MIAPIVNLLPRAGLVAPLLAAALAVGLARPPEVRAAAAAGEPIASRQTYFAIPFQITPPRSPDEAPTEVQLYVSNDHGLNWRLDSRLDPREGRFLFRAPHDGEYWFMIRSLDRAGHAQPEGAQQAGLKVLVDTLPPRMEFSAAEENNGEIVARWRAIDPYLNASTLRLEQQGSAAPNAAWQPISGTVSDVQHGPQSTSGTIRFRAPADAESLVVRAEIQDRAGNRAYQQASVPLRRTRAPVAPGAANPAVTPPMFAPGAAAGQTPPQPPAHASAGQTPGPPLFAPNAPRADGSTAWPADRIAHRPLAPEGDPAPNTAGPRSPERRDLASVGSDSPSSTAGFPAQLAALPGDTRATAPATGGPPPPGPAATAPPLTNISGSAAANGPSADGARPTAAGGPLYDPRLLPLGTTPQQVKSLKFQVDYSVDAPPGSGVGRVELWGTRDGGQNWASYGIDNDVLSPLVATVPGNGLYGFRVAVTGTDGYGEPPPQPGDAPQTWIAVDASLPAVRIVGVAPQGGDIDIRWEATDEQLEPQGIWIFYSHRADGDWKPIAERIPNSGQFTWRPDPRLGGPAFVRVDAHDRAGNIGSAVSREPILLDRPVPKSTINAIRPQ